MGVQGLEIIRAEGKIRRGARFKPSEVMMTDIGGVFIAEYRGMQGTPVRRVGSFVPVGGNGALLGRGVILVLRSLVIIAIVSVRVVTSPTRKGVVVVKRRRSAQRKTGRRKIRGTWVGNTGSFRGRRRLGDGSQRQASPLLAPVILHPLLQSPPTLAPHSDFEVNKRVDVTTEVEVLYELEQASEAVSTGQSP